MRLRGTRTRYRNWLNRRAWARGKTPLPDRIARRFSGMPVYRNRINRGTGRPHRDDKRLGATGDRALAQAKERRDRTAARASANQQHVRDTLAARQPQYAQQVERAARDIARGRTTRPPARSGRSRLWND